jgi:hypothetical protein
MRSVTQALSLSGGIVHGLPQRALHAPNCKFDEAARCARGDVFEIVAVTIDSAT